MDFEDFGAKTLRKVRIAAIFAGKVLLEVIFGPVFLGGGGGGGYGGANGRGNGGQNGGQIYGKIYPKIYPKIYGKIYGNPTTHLGGQIQKIVENRGR